MLIIGVPQYETQNDDGSGDGISPIPEWSVTRSIDPTALSEGDVAPDTWNVFTRLYGIFHRANRTPLPLLRLHDLTCFVVHRLLSPPASELPSSTNSDSIRCATILYMLILQGPIYYSHAAIMYKTAARLLMQLQGRAPSQASGQLDSWLVAVGLVASHNTQSYEPFQDMVRSLSRVLGLQSWKEASSVVKSVLWLEAPHTEHVFQSHWDIALGHDCQLVTFGSAQIAPSNTSNLDTSTKLAEIRNE